MEAKKYPVSCPFCQKSLHGPSVHCPFCGKEQEKETVFTETEKEPEVSHALSKTVAEHPPEPETIQGTDDTPRAESERSHEAFQENSITKNEHEEDEEEQEKTPLHHFHIDSAPPPFQEPTTTKPQPQALKSSNNHIFIILGIIAVIGAIGIIGVAGYFFLEVKKTERETIVYQEESKKAAEDAEKEMQRLKMLQEAKAREAEEKWKAKIIQDSIRKAEKEKQQINQYLAEGIDYYTKGKYELAINNMNEVLRRDSNNREATRYLERSRKELERIKTEWENVTTGKPR